jgi:GxxExxY protein
MNHEDTKTRRKDFLDGSGQVVSACFEVHRHLGPGLLESIYEECVCRELLLRGIPFRRQVDVPAEYKGLPVDVGYRLDVLVDERIILEVKAVEQLMPVHTAQVLTYLRMTSLRVALLVNFNVPVLKQGIRRIVL